MIRRKAQLATLVRRIEDSRPRSAQDRNHGLGWLITHVKLLTTVRDNDRTITNDSPSLQQWTNGRDRNYVKPEDDSTGNLVRRLLLCCPRLQVFLDAAPYGFDELPRSILTEIGHAPFLHSSLPSSAIDRRTRSPVGSPDSGLESEPEGDNVEEQALLAANGDCDLRELMEDKSRIRSIEWGYGSPSISDFLSRPPINTANRVRHAALGQVTRSIRTLRCNALSDPNCVFSTTQGILRPNPAIDHDQHLMEWVSELSLSKRARSLDDERPMLWMPKLVLLDMFLSSRSHVHWAALVAASTTTITLTTPTLSSSTSSLTSTTLDATLTPITMPSTFNGLPSLTHLAIRTPLSLGTIVGPEAIASLHVFLKAYGPQLKSLDLRVSPGDVEPTAQLPPPPAGIPMNPGAGNGNGEQDPVNGMLNIPLILARCPNLEELVISARWPSPHSCTSSSAATATATATANVAAAVPPPTNNANPNPNVRQNSSPFSVPCHDNLRRIGLRDTTPHVDGYSSTLSSRPCPCCRRVYMLSSASEVVFGGFMGGRNSGVNPGAGARTRYDAGTELVSAQMPYRPRTSPSAPPTTLAATQHPFPSALIESLLNGALLSNAYSLHETFPTSSSSSSNGYGTTRGQHGKSGMGGVMSHRHCTIDRHFRMMLSGVLPLGEPEPYLPPFVRDRRRNAVTDMLAAADDRQFDGSAHGFGGEGGAHRRSTSQTEEDIIRRHFGTAPRFPKLETIQLLDSHPAMFSNAKPAKPGGRRSRSSSASGLTRTGSLSPPTPVALALSMIAPPHVQGSGVPRLSHRAAPNDTNTSGGSGRYNDCGYGNEESCASTPACGTTCWCIPLEGRVEMNFWGAWAARCEARGIKLLDRAGKKVGPVYADFPASSSAAAAAAAPLSVTASTATVYSSSPSSSSAPSHSPSSASAPSSLAASSSLSVCPGPSKLENINLEDELNLSIIRTALLGNPNGGGSSRGVLVDGLRSSSTVIRRFLDVYAATLAIISLTLRSKGPSESDMTSREVLQRLVLWFAERGIISATSEYLLTGRPGVLVL